jgi:hypothetical protein
MIKLKEEYRNKRVSTKDGIEYDFRTLTPERIQRIYDTNPHLRHFFEEVVEVSPEIILNEEDFNNLVKEVVETPKKKRK